MSDLFSMGGLGVVAAAAAAKEEELLAQIRALVVNGREGVDASLEGDAHAEAARKRALAVSRRSWGSASSAPFLAALQVERDAIARALGFEWLCGQCEFRSENERDASWHANAHPGHFVYEVGRYRSAADRPFREIHASDSVDGVYYLSPHLNRRFTVGELERRRALL